MLVDEPGLPGTEQQDLRREAIVTEAVEKALALLRAEYTVMPRFGFHQPLDYHVQTTPPDFLPPVWISGVELPLPPPPERMGYPADDALYLEWGKFDHDLVVAQVQQRLGLNTGTRILDFGCSSGRVLRHFWEERTNLNWELTGVDIQARPIEWMRLNFPRDFCVYVGNALPHLPFEDNSFEVIYGFSIFTHIKYQWDAWLLELRRVLKPGGLLIQTIHTEHAWDFYRNHKSESWVRDSLPPAVWNSDQMSVPYFYHGDIAVSQIFWQREVARAFWGRYLTVLDVIPPPQKFSFQDWIVCQK